MEDNDLLYIVYTVTTNAHGLLLITYGKGSRLGKVSFRTIKAYTVQRQT